MKNSCHALLDHLFVTSNFRLPILQYYHLSFTHSIFHILPVAFLTIPLLEVQIMLAYFSDEKIQEEKGNYLFM
jgi:hypothetical protein